MIVAIVSSSFGTYGGIEAFVLALARAHAENKIYTPKIVWKESGDFKLTDELISRCRESGIPFEFVSGKSPSLFKAIQEATIVHAQNSPPDVVLFSKLLRKPLVLTVHNRRMKEHAWKSRGWFILQRMADRRWYNSEFVRKTWEGERNRVGSSVIPTVSQLPSGTIPCVERRGFCFASRWIPNKGIEILLEAYERGGFNPAEWPLQMIGSGPLFEKMRERYETTLGIIFHGFVSETEKADLIRKSKWMVIPPHTQEDLGLTAIEARSVGVPCIATRDGGLPEAAGECAILCEPGNCDSLLEGLQKAVAISEDDYERRSISTKNSLQHYLMPLAEYPKLYAEILGSFLFTVE